MSILKPRDLLRREFLMAGALGSIAPPSLSFSFLPQLFGSDAQRAKQQAAQNPPLRAIESCILIMYYGGPSHVDTWDMKPKASAEVRGEFQPISTKVPGRFVCEHLPKTAKIMDKLAVIRSMHHPMTNHNAAMYEALIGRLPPGGDAELLSPDRLNDFPNHGAVISHLTEKGRLPKPKTPLINVALPHVMYNVVRLAGQDAGFLNAQCDPFQVEHDPNEANFKINELTLRDDVSSDRMQSRLALLHALDRLPTSAIGTDALRENNRRALELVGNRQVQSAFEIERESSQVRDRYGRNRLGQSMLLARRLVESGVRFINVNDKIVNGQLANWDSHTDNFLRHKNDLLPPADQAFSALIEDLDQRGLLETTLVIGMGEFGRTPKINGSAGRDHWPDCYSVVVAGGGVNGGTTLGASDKIGAYPASHPVTPGDLAATIFWRFGLDPQQEIRDGFARPYQLANGDPIKELF